MIYFYFQGIKLQGYFITDKKFASQDRLAMPFHHLLDVPGDHLVESKEVLEKELPPNKDRSIRQNVDYTEGILKFSIFSKAKLKLK